MTYEKALEAVAMADTKHDLFKAAKALQCLMENSEVADPEMKQIIKSGLESHTNAVSGAVFEVPFSLRLIACMAKELGASSYVLIDKEAWCTFVSDDMTVQCFDPTTKLSHLLAGKLGVLYGMQVLTDAYYHPEEQFLPRNRLIVMSADGSRGLAVKLA